MGVVVGLSFVGYWIWWGIAFVESTVRPRYAVEWTSLFLVEHLEENEGRWPSGWDDLRDDSRDSGAYASGFDELQTLVDVRWDVELPRDRELFADERFRVVQLPKSNRFKGHLESDVSEWNRMVRDYVFLGERSQWLRDNLRKRDR